MATRRNSVPLAFPLPVVASPVLHEVNATEVKGFEPSATLSHVLPYRNHAQLDEQDGKLRVFLIASAWGMPKRHRRPPAVRLARDEWVRWHINYRFVDHCAGEWWYRLDTLSVAFGQVDADVFLGEPSRVVDERDRLA
jgi:hypothetical protein